MKTLPIDNLLVPMDFSPQAAAAYKYALDITKENKAKIILVHFVSDESKVEEAYEIMTTFLSKAKMTDQARTQTLVEIADIQKGIDQIAERFDASAIVLGKHNNSLYENIFGSKAIDLVESMHHPFIIVQHELPKEPITNILFAFNHQRESLQATQMVSSLAKLHGATVHLAPYEEYEEDLKNDLIVNEKLIVDHLMQLNIPFKIAKIPRGSLYKSLLISYAHSNDVNLMAAAYIDFGPNSFFQSFIDDLLMYDPEIPVMTVNGPEVMIHKPKLTFVPA